MKPTTNIYLLADISFRNTRNAGKLQQIFSKMARELEFRKEKTNLTIIGFNDRAKLLTPYGKVNPTGNYLLTAQADNIFITLKNSIIEERAVIKKQHDNVEKSVRALLLKSSRTSTQELVIEYEKQASEQLELKAQLQRSIDNLADKLNKVELIKNCFRNGSKKLLVDELFSSNEVAREIIRVFISKIEINDSNDSIEIFFNE